jgi:hypothetical protein
MDVPKQRLEGACRAHRFFQSIEVERRACLQDVAQVLGGNAHSVEFFATLWVLDIGVVYLEGFEPGSHDFPDLPIHVWSWDVSTRRMTDVHQLHERLLHLLSQLARSEPLDRLLYWLLQCLMPLLQTEEEALDTRPLLLTRLMLQEVFRTGDLDVRIAYFS